MCNRIRKALLVCFVLLLICCAANAEEILKEVTLETYASGGFPDQYAVMMMADDDFEEYIVEQLFNCAEEIPLRSYGMSEEVFMQRITDVFNNTPRLFFVSNRFSIGHTSSGIVTRMLPNYLISSNDLQSSLDAFDATVDEIADHASAASTPLGQLLLVNDYFCVNYSYDYSYSIYRPDLLFSGKKGVCQAYMLAYRAVLDELGITSTYASSESMNHTWNVVMLNGNWYHIDVTWNDPGTSYPLMSRHDYFMLSDSGMYANDHYGWTSAAYGADTAYDNFFWRESWCPVGVAGTEMYYLGDTDNDGYRSVLCWDESTGETNTVRDFSVRDYDGSFGLLNISRPAAADGSKIYHAARGNLIAANPDGSNPELVYASKDDREIFSCWRDGDTIKLMLGENPVSCEIVSCNVDDRVPLWLNIYPGFAELNRYEGGWLTASLPVGLDIDTEFTWISEDETIASVDTDGFVTSVDGGLVRVTASCDIAASAECYVLVEGEPVLKLPAAATSVEKQGFRSTAARIVKLPYGMKTIESRAFADSANLEYIIIPDSLVNIASNAFENCPNLHFVCSKYGEAYAYAKKAGIPCLISE